MNPTLSDAHNIIDSDSDTALSLQEKTKLQNLTKSMKNLSSLPEFQSYVDERIAWDERIQDIFDTLSQQSSAEDIALAQFYLVLKWLLPTVDEIDGKYGKRTEAASQKFKEYKKGELDVQVLKDVVIQASTKPQQNSVATTSWKKPQQGQSPEKPLKIVSSAYKEPQETVAKKSERTSIPARNSSEKINVLEKWEKITRNEAIKEYWRTPAVRNFNAGNTTDTMFWWNKVKRQRFTVFDSPQEWFQALIDKINNIKQWNSEVYQATMKLSQYIHKYAPPHENDTIK